MTRAETPSVRRLREELAPYRRRPLSSALLRLAFSLAVYAAAFAGAALSSSLPLRFAAGVVAGLFSGNLFMIGHDACHGSYTRIGWLNQILGRIAFLPSYHPYSVWDYSHNRVHHVYTNLRRKDFVWTPLSKEEFDALPWTGRALYRIYRTPLGLALYYPLSLWRERLFFPRARFLDRPRPIYTLDGLLISAYLLAQAAIIQRTSAGWPELLAGLSFGIVLPWLVFGWLIGFVVYFNHTHPEVVWYDDRAAWSFFEANVRGTVRLSFPRWTSFFSSNIMNHLAHHVEPRIPLVRLKAAQERREELLQGQVITQEWSARELRRILRVCRLYDYELQRWTDYDGTPTTPASRPERGPTERSMIS